MIKKRLFSYVICTLMILMHVGISLIVPIINKNAIDNGIIKKDMDVFIGLCFFAFLLIVVSQIFSLLSDKLFFKTSSNMLFEIYKTMISKIFRQPICFFTNQTSGYINARIDEFWEILSMFSPSLIMSLISLVEFIGAIVIMFCLSAKLTLFSLLFVFPMFFIFKKISKKQVSSLSECYENNAKLKSVLDESLKNIEDIKYFCLEDKIASDINFKSKNYTDIQNKSMFLMQLSFKSIAFMIAISVSLSSYLIGRESIIKGLSIGTFTTFVLYVQKIYSPIISFSNFLTVFQKFFLVKNRLKELMKFENLENENKDNEKIESIKSIAIENIDFSYDKNHKILKNFNMKAKIGELVVIKGLNGTGKSTVTKLITGILKQSQGSIKINGIDRSKICQKSLCNNISVVSQAPFLFNSTIKENVVLEKFKKEKYEKILKIFNIKDSQSKIGENGIKLSGGQKKKVAIARAIYKNFDVLIIDEAFSNLDKETSENFKNYIKNIKSNKIIISIQHSDFLDDICDKIYTIGSIDKYQYNIIKKCKEQKCFV